MEPNKEPIEGQIAEEPKKETLVARKRIFFLLLAIALVVLAFIIWEIVDLSLGGLA